MLSQSTTAVPILSQAQPPPTPTGGDSQIWMVSTGALALMLITGAVIGKVQWDKLQKQIRMEAFRSRELKKRLDTALKLVQRMERNPDLVHSREFNLDYLRMRMEEETFHFAIVNQIKMKIKMLVSLALRPTQKQAGSLQQGNAGTNRKVDHTFDVEYETNDGTKRKKRVLFRVQISLMKLPTQPTSKTIEEIIKCLEHYLSCSEGDEDRWQPTLQGRIATISWDQKAKPTPLLVMNQSQEGMNVTMRSRRRDVTAVNRGRSPAQAQQQKAQGGTQGKVRQRTVEPQTRNGATGGTNGTRGRTGGQSQGTQSGAGKSSNTQVRRIR
ncbi:MAG: hypothetical protein AAGA67_00890 [Cyanobacteria bacterium P01_F01_bin.153]